MAKFLTLSHLKIFFKSLKEKLSPVAFSGNYEDIIDTPELADVATSGDYNDLIDTPQLANVATSGNYDDLNNKPTIGGYVTIGQIADQPIGSYATAEGFEVNAAGQGSHAEGQATAAEGYNSHAEGSNTMAMNADSHAEGASTYATGPASHAEGRSTTAKGDYSHSEGNYTKAQGNTSHSEGNVTIAIGSSSHVEGQGASSFLIKLTYSSTNKAFTIQTIPTSKELTLYQIISYNSTSWGYISAIENDLYKITWQSTVVFTDGKTYSFEVYPSGAYGENGHGENYQSTAIGNNSHAEGAQTKAIGIGSHAEGSFSRALGEYSHAEGSQTKAEGNFSHAEGNTTTASGIYSHAEGYGATASGYAAHAEGLSTQSTGYYTHAEGASTIANHRAQHVFGTYNIADDSAADPLEKGNYIEIVGNGEHNARSNARTLDWNGNEVLAGTLKTSSSGITIGNTTITETQLQQLSTSIIINLTTTGNSYTGNIAYNDLITYLHKGDLIWLSYPGATANDYDLRQVVEYNQDLTDDTSLRIGVFSEDEYIVYSVVDDGNDGITLTVVSESAIGNWYRKYELVMSGGTGHILNTSIAEIYSSFRAGPILFYTDNTAIAFYYGNTITPLTIRQYSPGSILTFIMAGPGDSEAVLRYMKFEDDGSDVAITEDKPEL